MLRASIISSKDPNREKTYKLPSVRAQFLLVITDLVAENNVVHLVLGRVGVQANVSGDFFRAADCQLSRDLQDVIHKHSIPESRLRAAFPLCVFVSPDQILAITGEQAERLQASMCLVPAQDLFRAHAGKMTVTAVKKAVFDPGLQAVSRIHIE